MKKGDRTLFDLQEILDGCIRTLQNDTKPLKNKEKKPSYSKISLDSNENSKMIKNLEIVEAYIVSIR